MTIPSSIPVYTQGFGTAFTGAPVVSTVNPTSSNVTGPNGPFKIGQVWVNDVANSVWTLTSLSSAGGSITATWTETTNAAGVVTSVTGTANEITAAPTTGAVVLSLPAVLIAPGSLEVKSGFAVDAGLAEFKSGVTVDFDAGSSVNFGADPAFSAGLTVNAGDVDILSVAAQIGNVNIGNATSTGSIDINCGSGDFTIVGNGFDIDIGVDSTTTTIQIGNVNSSSSSLAGLTALVSGGTVTLLAQTEILIGLPPSGQMRFENQSTGLAFAAGGTGATIGTVTLASGLGVVTTTAFLGAATPVFFSYNTYGSVAGGFLTGYTTSAGGFTIATSDLTDSTSTVNWWVIGVS